MEFNSAICTTEEQSKKLLALGLKAETADMCYKIHYFDFYGMLLECIHTLEPGPPLNNDGFIPAWSLSRLMEILPDEITIPDTGDNDGCEGELEDLILEPTLFKKSVNYSDGYSTIFFEDHDNIYDNIIDCIKWLIEKGQFNKEYLEEQICGH